MFAAAAPSQWTGKRKLRTLSPRFSLLFMQICAVAVEPAYFSLRISLICHLVNLKIRNAAIIRIQYPTCIKIRLDWKSALVSFCCVLWLLGMTYLIRYTIVLVPEAREFNVKIEER